ncbi:SCO family protein (plasmid) [Rhizobium leguminosarum]|uniref:SCO family protein n=1 Tax=Rhizobium leguminosarum TaxID=384 RepID=UPI001030872E|nr:SCO family protein [Rhizobium leguminosarum]TAZ47091.1 SCO family protein [Rhizobium leguminosarum]
MTIRKRIFAGLATALLLVCGSVGWVAWHRSEQASAVDTAFGAPFKLTDDRDQPITEVALQGHPSLIYFGYTHCPDVCPTTLYDMAGWFKTLGPNAGGLKAYFFSVDPERDSAEIMHSYTSNFTDRITGITGDPVEMQKAIKGWRIYAKKVPTPDGDYTMDHTASVLLIDAKGNFKGTISYGEDTEVALKKIRNLIQ